MGETGRGGRWEATRTDDRRARGTGDAAQGEPLASASERHPAGSGEFFWGGTRPPIKEVVTFIDAHRDCETGGRRWAVESICEQLQFAPRTYYDQKCRPPSKRAINDEEFGDQLEAIWKKSYAVYGRRKLWKATLRAGFAEVMPGRRCQGSLRDAAAVDVIYADDQCHQPRHRRRLPPDRALSRVHDNTGRPAVCQPGTVRREIGRLLQVSRSSSVAGVPSVRIA